MKLNRVCLLFMLGLVVLLFGILTLFFWDFVRDSIALPIYYFLWLGNLVLKSIPQQAYLSILLLIGIVIALNTLRSIRVSQPTSGFIEDRHSTPSRYGFWKNVVASLPSNVFSREQFTQETRKLILSMLAHQESVSVSEIETMITVGTLSVPAAVKVVLRRESLQVAEPPPTTLKSVLFRWRDRLLNRTPPRDPQLDPQVEEIIQFIEQHMELTDARH